MEYNRTTPSADGYYMPAEYEPHKGCIMIWPQRPGSWNRLFVQLWKRSQKVSRCIWLPEKRFLHGQRHLPHSRKKNIEKPSHAEDIFR